MARKVVVTGGAGFIGSHLAECLAKKSYHVVILDDLSTGKINNLEPLLRKGNVELIQRSVTELPLLGKLFQGADYVFHQAPMPSMLLSLDNPQASHQVGITGTLNVLLAARDSGVKKVIYASSSAVYGDSPIQPLREDMLPSPQSPYAVTKLAGEYYCQVFHHVYALPTVCLRYFNVYGPRQDPESPYASVIPRFISRVSQGSPPVILGDGEQTRDFTFIGDTVGANILAAESDAIGVFNIGGGESVTINQLARLIIGLLGSSVEPVYGELRPGDIRHSLADISKANTFGYEPKCNLEAGLENTIRWFSKEEQPRLSKARG